MAIEAVIYSASKKDKATGILSEGVDILKKLHQSKNQPIKVRALVVSILNVFSFGKYSIIQKFN